MVTRLLTRQMLSLLLVAIELFHGGAGFIINVLIIKLRDHPSVQLMVLSFNHSPKLMAP